MNQPFSVYLDLVRFAAAVLVYIYHSNQRPLVTEVLPASQYGHSAVIVFFVLSGFVIAYVTDTKERDWKSYAASRLSRVYSVALPAIVLTVLLDALGRSLMPSLYRYPFDHISVRAVSSALMLNEWWLVSITSFSNVPYWSICYESFYYLAFGIATFLSRRWRWWALAALAAFVGPKIVMLAPIWLAGVVLYRWRWLTDSISLSLAWMLFGVSVVGIVAFHAVGVEPLLTALFKAWIGERLHEQLTFSKFFLSDYVLTALVVTNFAAMRTLAPATAGLWRRIERPVRYAAGFTFTLYLLHQPLFLFWGAVIAGDPATYTYWTMVTLATFASVMLVGHFTESRRHPLRRWIAQRLMSGSRHAAAAR